MQIHYTFMNDFLLFGYTFMNDFLLFDYTFMNDFCNFYLVLISCLSYAYPTMSFQSGSNQVPMRFQWRQVACKRAIKGYSLNNYQRLLPILSDTYLTHILYFTYLEVTMRSRSGHDEVTMETAGKQMVKPRCRV